MDEKRPEPKVIPSVIWDSTFYNGQVGKNLEPIRENLDKKNEINSRH